MSIAVDVHQQFHIAYMMELFAQDALAYVRTAIGSVAVVALQSIM